jgi:hypothetical protein
MKKHIIIPKVIPQLIRKRTVATSNIKVVISPDKQETKNLIDLQNKHQPVPAKRQAPPPAQEIQQSAAVSKQHLIKKSTSKPKPTTVKYVTREVTIESPSRVKQLKNKGQGKILLIIGNGPSLNEVEMSKFNNHPNIHIMSINKPDSRVWPTTYWAFFDLSQLRRHEDLWNGYEGIIFNSTAIKRQKEKSMQLKNLGGRGFGRDLVKGLHIGRSSVYAAMQIAYWINYDHVYIFGCDMDPEGVNGNLHFYGTNPDVDPNVRKTRFVKEAEYYDQAAEILNQEERKKFTFCSSYNKWPFVERYNKLDHIAAVDHIISHANKLCDANCK